MFIGPFNLHDDQELLINVINDLFYKIYFVQNQKIIFLSVRNDLHTASVNTRLNAATFVKK